MVEPGVYHETVYVDVPKITIKGIIDGEDRPWLDGDKKLSDGFNTTGDDFTLENFGVRNYIGNGVLTTRTERVIYRNNIIQDTGLYGLYPVESAPSVPGGTQRCERNCRRRHLRWAEPRADSRAQ